MLEAIIRSGFPATFKLIHLFEGGSKLHGARIEGKNDLDIYGVFIETPDKSLGLDPYEHFVTSTSDSTRKNTADDVDITLYSLKRWAQLAAKGNPTALNFLFATNYFNSAYYYENVWNRTLESLREAVVARSAAGHYRGFVEGQMKRLYGEGTGKHGQRTDLIEQLGYDTKAGMHSVRLLGEGIELMQTGRITFPRPNAAELINVRQGNVPFFALCQRVHDLMAELELEYQASPLPAKPDRQRVSGIVSQMYMESYTR